MQSSGRRRARQGALTWPARQRAVAITEEGKLAVQSRIENSPTYGSFIGGEWVPSDRTFDSINPARPSEVVGRFALATPADVEAAYAAASDAAPGWRRTSAVQRGDILHRAANLMEPRIDELGAELTREEGKTLAEGRGEIKRGIAILRYFAGEALQPSGSVYPSTNYETFLYAVREPLGVVSIITPWNFPVAIPLWKLAPALAFGNTVVWKPSELTPLCAARLTEVFAEAGLPPGVLNLVTGDPSEIGDAITSHPAVVGLSFTGSARVGRMIQAAVTPRGVKVQLELGGKNPVIVLEDADLDLAVEQTLRGAMYSTGQKCTATSRAIVLDDVAPRFTELLVNRARELVVGDPLDDQTNVGPLVSREQLERVLGYLELARQEGHRLLLGGDRVAGEDGGYFVAPTVYEDIDPDSRLGQEEVFGPVLGTIRASDLEQAIEIANSVEFGLSASIFTRDIGRAFEFIREIRSGVIHVNSETAGAEPQAPFGGMKGSSSHSREQGKAAVEFYTDTKTVYLDMPGG
jgi:acyl-CoA reductase-like NAD-dependent aldehyde dehydrogenase